MVNLASFVRIYRFLCRFALFQKLVMILKGFDLIPRQSKIYFVPIERQDSICCLPYLQLRHWPNILKFSTYESVFQVLYMTMLHELTVPFINIHDGKRFSKYTFSYGAVYSLTLGQMTVCDKTCLLRYLSLL